jgi:hypothetical protein
VRLTAGTFANAALPDSPTTSAGNSKAARRSLISTEFSSAGLLTISQNYDNRLNMLVLL